MIVLRRTSVVLIQDQSTIGIIHVSTILAHFANALSPIQIVYVCFKFFFYLISLLCV